MKILLASSNKNKAIELSPVMPGHKILLPQEIGINFDFEETGLTFLDNALGKAKDLFNQTKTPVIGEDSGLCVPALGGEPGIYSARYGSDGTNKLGDKERNSYLLKKMENITDRRAYFICSMVLVLDCDRFYVCQETVDGEILHEPRGEGGFGYDPLFYIKENGKTAAELTADEKNIVSHRGRAGRAMAELIKSLKELKLC
ncbi:MAG: RdgB/HAM1 family non-canonical purine NTP pyrophosphatase [Spirochaetia bacterium]|jgi:XTP/dITP diphosphohydrolase|nr:RdgB/HAM1 family non-canonical purine NTP pyrophosphatase [Spirochaetia bacterium]